MMVLLSAMGAQLELSYSWEIIVFVSGENRPS